MHYSISAYYSTISSYLLQAKTFFLKNAVNTQHSFPTFTTPYTFRIRESILLLSNTSYTINNKKVVMDTGHNIMLRRIIS